MIINIIIIGDAGSSKDHSTSHFTATSPDLTQWNVSLSQTAAWEERKKNSSLYSHDMKCCVNGDQQTETSDALMFNVGVMESVYTPDNYGFHWGNLVTATYADT